MSIYSDFLPSRRGETQVINVIDYSNPKSGFVLGEEKIGDAALRAWSGLVGSGTPITIHICYRSNTSSLRWFSGSQ